LLRYTYIVCLDLVFKDNHIDVPVQSLVINWFLLSIYKSRQVSSPQNYAQAGYFLFMYSELFLAFLS
jgi:hypothetical protein